MQTSRVDCFKVLFWGFGCIQEKIQAHLRSLRKALAEFLDWRASEEKRRLDYLETSEAERRRIGAEFERLRRFLAEKERAALGRLAELDAAFEAAQAEKSLRLDEGITQLHGLIGQLEAKRPPQAIGSILSSWSETKLQVPSGLPAELEESLSLCRRSRDALREALKGFGDTLRPETKLGTGTFPSAEEKAKVPPEPGAAPLPQFLSDRKSARWDEEEEEEQDEAKEPLRGQEPAGGCEGVAPGRRGTRTR
ncbi:E3 ubiquitin-protein ligase TRIM7-like isoform 2-T4 [Phoenicopterus ruber ruber]